MKKLAAALVVLVAIEHFYFLVLEMFYWTEPLGMKTFGLTADFAQASASLAMNQGLYNGFLAAGLLFGLLRKNGAYGTQVFFLCCVVVAGVFGAVTAKPTILYVQAAPAFVALVFVFLANRRSANYLD